MDAYRGHSSLKPAPYFLRILRCGRAGGRNDALGSAGLALATSHTCAQEVQRQRKMRRPRWRCTSVSRVHTELVPQAGQGAFIESPILLLGQLSDDWWSGWPAAE